MLCLYNFHHDVYADLTTAAADADSTCTPTTLSSKLEQDVVKNVQEF